MDKHTDLISRMQDEADLCRNDGATDIASLLDEAVAALRDRNHDTAVGEKWRTDSRLEEWFPLTAERLAALEAENAALKRVLVYARGGLTNGRTRMREDIKQLTAELAALRERVGLAYGHLWCVNNEPGTPHQCTPERAAYEARKLLRDTMTHEERGEYINRVLSLVRGVEA